MSYLEIFTNKYRVKLYHSEADGNWNEIGTGVVSLRPNNVGTLLVVECETASTILLESQVSCEDIYDRQSENIILWNEIIENSEIGLALSFQDTSGCKFIWNVLSSGHRELNKTYDSQAMNVDEDFENFPIPLPECSLNSLLDIKQKLMAVTGSKQALISGLLKNDACYVMQLLRISSEAEHMEYFDIMDVLSSIWRILFLQNDVQLLEFLTKETIYLQVIAAFEYDKSLVSRGSYREFLTSVAKYRSVGSLKNPGVKQLADKLFRLKYLKEYMLRPTIDEIGVGALNSVISTTAEEICTMFFCDTTYLSSVVDTIISKNNNQDVTSNRLNCIRFLRELFQTLRQISFDRRSDILQPTLHALDSRLYECIESVLVDKNSTIEERQSVSEILVSIVIVVPHSLRQHVVQGQVPAAPQQQSLDGATQIGCILFVIMARIVDESESSVIEQLSDVVKILLDVDRMQTDDQNVFLVKFYDFYLIWLVYPFTEPNIPSNSCSFLNDGLTPEQDYNALSTSRRVTFEIFTLCVQQHSYRMKYFVMRNSLLLNTVAILKSRTVSKQLCLYVIKFFRAVIVTNDEFYLKHICKFDMMRHIFYLLENSANKDNLVVSSILELIELIRLENIHVLINYIVESHQTSFENLSRDGFDRLKLKYDQIVDSNANQPKSSSETQKMYRNDKFQYSDDLEAYLLDDDDSGSVESANSNPLEILYDYRGNDEISRKLNGSVSPLSPTYAEDYSFAKGVLVDELSGMDSTLSIPSLPPQSHKFDTEYTEPAFFNLKKATISRKSNVVTPARLEISSQPSIIEIGTNISKSVNLLSVPNNMNSAKSNGHYEDSPELSPVSSLIRTSSEAIDEINDVNIPANSDDFNAQNKPFGITFTMKKRKIT